MISSDLHSRAEILRSAIDGDDTVSAEAALQEYVACFRSEARTLVEVAQARGAIEAALQIAAARRAAIASELARLTTVASVYKAPRMSNTWQLDA